MQSLQKDTLAYQLGVRPGVAKRDMSAVPLTGVVDSLVKFSNGASIGGLVGVEVAEGPKGYPEVDALTFYLLNHAVALVRQRVHPYEKLGEYGPLLEMFHQQLAFRSARAFFYLLLITTRESRHERSKSGSGFLLRMNKDHGPTIFDFHQGIKGTSTTTAASALRNSPPDVALGSYTAFLVDVFNKGSYSGGYGGKAWGKVAECLHAFVTGVYSAEMMMDTVFTLCHNNGPIFNKGMLYHGYSSDLITILDVQRSGQIPQLVSEKSMTHSKDNAVREAFKECAKVFPAEFSGYVDWYKVEDLGALHKYPSQKHIQVQKYGYPSGYKEKIVEEQKKKEEAAAAFVAAEQAKAKSIEIMPGCFVPEAEVTR